VNQVSVNVSKRDALYHQYLSHKIVNNSQICRISEFLLWMQIIEENLKNEHEKPIFVMLPIRSHVDEFQ